MPNSLKSRLKGLVRKGLLSERDFSRIYTDNDVFEELEKIKAEMAIKTQENLYAYKDCLEIVRNHIAELKGENNE